MYAYINCLNRLFVDVRARARASAGETKPGAEQTGASRADLDPGLENGRAKVPKTILEELELLDWVDFLESFLIHLQATLCITTSHKCP